MKVNLAWKKPGDTFTTDGPLMGVAQEPIHWTVLEGGKIQGTYFGIDLGTYKDDAGLLEEA